MSNPNTFINNYINAIIQLANLMDILRSQNDQLVQDPTIVTRYFAQDGTGGSTKPRPDLVAIDVTNAQAAIVQMLFTFDSGSPTQKSKLFKLLP